MPFSPVSLKRKFKPSGLFYLVGIALSVAVAANRFGQDDGILLLPIVGVIIAIVLGLWVKRRFGASK